MYHEAIMWALARALITIVINFLDCVRPGTKMKFSVFMALKRCLMYIYNSKASRNIFKIAGLLGL